MLLSTPRYLRFWRWGLGIRVCCSLLLWMIHGTSARQTAIADSVASYPYVALLDPPLPMDWDRGRGALELAQSSAVRINSKGIQYIPPSYSELQLSDRFETPCIRSRNCMCVMNVSGVISNVFPERGTRVYITSTTQKFLPVSTDCAITSSGRTVLIGLGSNQDPVSGFGEGSHPETRMDLSLCNLVDGQMDVVYVPATSRIYITTNSISTPVVVVLSLLVLYVAAIMCHNIEYLLNSPTVTGSKKLYMDNFMVSFLLFLNMFSDGDMDILKTFITLED